MSATGTTVALSANIVQTCCHENFVLLAYENIGQITSSIVCNLIVVVVVTQISFAVWCLYPCSSLPLLAITNTPCSAVSLR